MIFKIVVEYYATCISKYKGQNLDNRLLCLRRLPTAFTGCYPLNWLPTDHQQMVDFPDNIFQGNAKLEQFFSLKSNGLSTHETRCKSGALKSLRFSMLWSEYHKILIHIVPINYKYFSLEAPFLGLFGDLFNDGLYAFGKRDCLKFCLLFINVLPKTGIVFWSFIKLCVYLLW